MNEETKKTEAVSTQTEAAETSKTPVVETPDLASQAIAIAEETAKKLEQAEKDRDNYKAGMLAKDRKIKELRDEGYDIPEDVVQPQGLTIEAVEKLLDAKLSTIQQTQVQENVLTKQISELKTALVNRQGLPSTPTGNSTESAEVKPSRWVDDPAQKAALVARGLDPDKVYNNWKASQVN